MSYDEMELDRIGDRKTAVFFIISDTTQTLSLIHIYYYIPDLKLSEQPEAAIGKYGRMRQRYLKEHRPGLYSSLILSEKLYPHLLEIDRAARERMDAMLPRMMEAAGVTEERKARDPMRWVGLIDVYKRQVGICCGKTAIGIQIQQC